MSWIFQNKLLYTGPSGVEQFSNALLLHLQSLNSTPSVSTTAAGLMYNQVIIIIIIIIIGGGWEMERNFHF